MGNSANYFYTRQTLRVILNKAAGYESCVAIGLHKVHVCIF